MVDLSIIIVNYNGSAYLKGCFDSIYDKISELTFEIIVVDNDSHDDSITLIKDYDNKIRLIESKENLGFARGNNLGFKYSSGKHILLLNNDTVLESNVKSAIDFISDNKDVKIIGAKMYGKDNEYRLSAGYFPTFLRVLKISRLYKIDNGFSDGTMESKMHNVDWVEGSFMLTSYETYQNYGGLAEDIFMYGEDVDFCKRVNLDKGKTIVDTNLTYQHFGGYNEGRFNMLMSSFIRYNRKYTKTLFEKFLFSQALNLNIIIKTAKELFKRKRFDKILLSERIELLKLF